MNLQDRDVELNFRQVTCKRDVTNDAFSRGIQDFDFSVSGKNAFIPSLSYFVIEVSLQVVPTNRPRIVDGYNNGGTVTVPPPQVGGSAVLRRPYLMDGIALADHFGSTLYNNAYFRAGNSDVSLIQQFIPQAGVLKSRLDKSFAWSKSIGRSVMLDDADFERRRSYVSLDGTFHDDGLKSIQYTERELYTDDYVIQARNNTAGSGVAYTYATGLLSITPSATVVSPVISGWRVGDIIELSVAGAALFFKIIESSYGAGLNSNISPVEFVVQQLSPAAPTANIGAAADVWVRTVQTPHDPACGSNTLQVIFQPPIGIFSEANPISGGDFKIALNPSPSFATSGIQSMVPMTAYQQGLTQYDYKLVIQNVFFYVCTIKSDVSPTGVIPLSLVEMAVLNKNMNQNQSQNLDFTVPPSTLAITVFVQAGVASTTTTLPATKFLLMPVDGNNDPTVVPFSNLQEVVAKPNIANNIQSIQVTYGSLTKTQTLYTSRYSNDIDKGVNFNIQRFLQSIQYSGKIVSEGGSESDPQYLERGNYWHYDFSKDKNDTSSYVNVQIAFNSAVPANSNLFIVAHYSRQCEIMYENGFITQVVSVNR